MITTEEREAAEESVGWALSDKDVEDALAAYASTPTPQLEDKLEKLINTFEAAGGRGVELADEIDKLRIAIAARHVREDVD